MVRMIASAIDLRAMLGIESLLFTLSCGARRHVTVRTPCMIVRCGSQTKRYVPFFNLTIHFVVPLPLTLVFLSTPGPVRWKSWIDARSWMVIAYVPAFTDFLLIEIVKPGPTVPVSVLVVAAAVADAGLAIATIASIVVRLPMIFRMDAPWVAGE